MRGERLSLTRLAVRFRTRAVVIGAAFLTLLLPTLATTGLSWLVLWLTTPHDGKGLGWIWIIPPAITLLVHGSWWLRLRQTLAA